MKNQFNYPRIIFLCLILLFAVLLAFRPVPSILENNDSGRYVDTYHQVCNSPFSFDWSKRLTWESYNFITKLSCVVESEILYLFLVALPVPLAFFIFGVWIRNSFLIASSILISFAGFEFMTNALRQSVSLFFLLGAFSYIGRPYFQIIYIIPAILLHGFSFVFIPLLMLLSYLRSHSIKFTSVFFYGSIALGLVFLALTSLINVYLGGQGRITDLYDIFQKKYEVENSGLFQYFAVLPIIWIFYVRWFFDKDNVSLEECATIVYFVVIFIITTIWFPYITFRFAMGATVLQLFLAMKNNNSNKRVPRIIIVGLFVHMLIYIIVSENVLNVILG